MFAALQESLQVPKLARRFPQYDTSTILTMSLFVCLDNVSHDFQGNRFCKEFVDSSAECLLPSTF